MAQSRWDAQFPTESIEQKARHAQLDLPEVWQELLAYYIEHWGCFGCTLAALPALHEEELALVHRRMELNGTHLYRLSVQPEMGENFYNWLEEWLPSIWGWRKDLCRVALMIEMDTPMAFSIEGAQRSVLARRFPIPILFAWNEKEDWKEWWKEHEFLIPSSQHVIVNASLLEN